MKRILCKYPFGAFQNVRDIELRWDDLTAQLASLNQTSPVDENRVYNEFLENQRANFAEGVISQEEYDRLLQEAGQYAEIIK